MCVRVCVYVYMCGDKYAGKHLITQAPIRSHEGHRAGAEVTVSVTLVAQYTRHSKSGTPRNRPRKPKQGKLQGPGHQQFAFANQFRKAVLQMSALGRATAILAD